MCVKILIAGIAVAATLLSNLANASPLWTLTGRGIITEGFDTTGLFGVNQRSLVGCAFTQKITADTDPGKWEHYSTDGETRSQLVGVGPGFTTVVTVAGVTVKYKVRLTEEGQQLVISHAGQATHVGEHVASSQIGLTDSDEYVEAYLGAWNYKIDLVQTHTFDQSVNVKFDPLLYFGSKFETFGGHEAFFQGDLSSLHVRSNRQHEVPEPGSFALLGLGIAAFALTCRKKAKA